MGTEDAIAEAQRARDEFEHPARRSVWRGLAFAGIAILIVAGGLLLVWSRYDGRVDAPGFLRRYPVADLETFAAKLNAAHAETLGCGVGPTRYVAVVDTARSRVVVDQRPATAEEAAAPDNGPFVHPLSPDDQGMLARGPLLAPAALHCGENGGGEPPPTSTVVDPVVSWQQADPSNRQATVEAMPESAREAAAYRRIAVRYPTGWPQEIAGRAICLKASLGWGECVAIVAGAGAPAVGGVYARDLADPIEVHLVSGDPFADTSAPVFVVTPEQMARGGIVELTGDAATGTVQATLVAS